MGRIMLNGVEYSGPGGSGGSSDESKWMLDYFSEYGRVGTANIEHDGDGRLFQFKVTDEITIDQGKMPKGNGHIIHLNWDEVTAKDAQIGISINGQVPTMQIRACDEYGWGLWKTLLDSTNYKEFCTPGNIGAASEIHKHRYLPSCYPDVVMDCDGFDGDIGMRYFGTTHFDGHTAQQQAHIIDLSGQQYVSDQDMLTKAQIAITPYNSDNGSRLRQGMFFRSRDQGQGGFPDWDKVLTSNYFITYDRVDTSQGYYALEILPFFGGYIQFSEEGVMLGYGYTESGCDLFFGPTHDYADMSLGSPVYLWDQIYAYNSAISTSDRNEKFDISYVGQENDISTNTSDSCIIDLIMGMKPAVYKKKNGKSGRPHHGMVAQDIEELINSLGIDHAGLIKTPKTKQIEVYSVDDVEVLRREVNVEDVTDEIPPDIIEEYGEDVCKKIESEVIEEEFRYGLRYEEFIGDIIRFCQILKEENDDLKSQISSIKNDLELLKNS